jgi:hypothetical protein
LYKQKVIGIMKEDLLKDWISQERMNESKFWVVWNIWVLIADWKPLQDNWIEYFSNLPWLEEDSDLQFALWETWYQMKEWKIFRNWQEIPQFLENWNINPKFVEAVDNLSFYADIQWVFWMVKAIKNWKKITNS